MAQDADLARDNAKQMLAQVEEQTQADIKKRGEVLQGNATVVKYSETFTLLHHTLPSHSIVSGTTMVSRLFIVTYSEISENSQLMRCNVT